MQPEFMSVGISLEKFFIENVSMPEELKKEIFEYTRLDKIDLDKLTKFKTAKAIEAAVLNDGGLQEQVWELDLYWHNKREE